jgi:hypothetical protein
MDHKNLDIKNNTYITSKNTPDDKEYFTIKGQEDFLDESGYPRISDDNQNKVFAKKYKNINLKYRFMILVNNYRKLYNPISIYGMEKKDPFINNDIRSDKKFIEVNETCFHYYLMFLATKNTLWLTKAEREV